MKQLGLIIIAFLFISFSGSDAFVGDEADFFYPTSNNHCVLIQHRWYSLCYSEKHEQAAWVYYRLTNKMCETNSVKRKNIFYVDSLVLTGSAMPNDYKKSGYDRGHLCPAGDMNFSEESMRESFYMSNMSPQLPVFNRGGWRRLEEYVRKRSVIDTALHIVTGGVLQNDLQTIGRANKVSVPQYFYKVLLDYNGPDKKAIAFLMPNTIVQGSLYNYVVSVDSVEKLTGINFFAQLPDSVQGLLECCTDTVHWKIY